MMDEVVYESARTRVSKMIISSLVVSLPFFLIIFALIVSVFAILGIFGKSDLSGSSGSTIFISGSGDALYDGSFTREEFINVVEAYNPPNVTHNGRTYIWGYETFFIENAGNFFDIATSYGLDPRFIFCIGLHESAFGTSNIALNKGNFFGWGAYDSSPYDSALTFYDMSNGIETVSSGLANNYISSSGTWHNYIIEGGYSPSSIAGIGYRYASDEGWANKVISHMTNIFNVDFDRVNSNPITLEKLEEYPLSGGNADIMIAPLNSSQVAQMNNYIQEAIDKNGYGTGAGVAAAGQALTYGLYQMGYRLPYVWGGGHGDGNVVVGFKSNWGMGKNALDCSGFVSWAIVNGCNPDFTTKTTREFYNMNIPTTTIAGAEPGDLMVKNGHICLVLYSNGTNVIVAHESGTDAGLIFSSYSTLDGGYKIMDMGSWYSNYCKG